MPEQIVQEPNETNEEPAQPTTYFKNLEEFVRDFVCPVFRRNVGEAGRAEYRWSAEWWTSAEAITRLEAMWRTFEQARLDPNGMSAWLRDHADYHLGVLMSPSGPFADSRDASQIKDPLPCCPCPNGLF